MMTTLLRSSGGRWALGSPLATRNDPSAAEGQAEGECDDDDDDDDDDDEGESSR
jgi:hypothetical protein